MTKPIYKAGDTLTVRMSGKLAELLNHQENSLIKHAEIIAHEPKRCNLELVEDQCNSWRHTNGLETLDYALLQMIEGIIQYLREQKSNTITED